MPVLPKFHDNFAFNEEQKRKDYYDTYGAFANTPQEKFSIVQLLKAVLKGILIFIFWIIFILAIYLLINGWN